MLKYGSVSDGRGLPADGSAFVQSPCGASDLLLDLRDDEDMDDEPENRVACRFVGLAKGDAIYFGADHVSV
jgi:hypothetical protein